MENQTIEAKAASITIFKLEAKSLMETALWLSAAVAAPALLAHTPHNQWITGTMVNAILFLAAKRLPLANALTIAVFPSTIALLRGLLPAPMAMLIPYIIISNAILIATFSISKLQLFSRMVAASLAKFAFLFLISYAFASSQMGIVIQMLGWPQLVTALAGGNFGNWRAQNF